MPLKEELIKLIETVDVSDDVLRRFASIFFFYWGDSDNKEEVAARTEGPGLISNPINLLNAH
jgi:hypothetical protein